MIEILLLLGAYLIGAVPFAMVSSRIFQLADPRSYGSGNPGATNVLRSGHKAAALVTLLGDAFKGWLAVGLAHALGGAYGAAEWIAPACGLAAFAGHLYPVYIGFKGGKGVATALGVLLAFSPWIALGCALCWMLVALASRYSSAAALTAAAAAPPLTWLTLGSASETAVSIVMAALLTWRHAANIRRLLAGEEPKIGRKKT